MSNLLMHVGYRKSSRDISALRSSIFSQSLLRDCNEQAVKNSILALRRGPLSYRRNSMIVCEGDAADYIFLVVKGTVRSCRTYPDGSRGIIAFHFPGELFGWSSDAVHSLSAEAVTDTQILFFKRSTLNSAAGRNSKIASYLLTATISELRRVQEHSLMMGRLAAYRVASFLIDLSVRTGQPKYLKLPMSLIDIADHLGLKMETVSRTIATLGKSGLIARSSYRTLVLRNRALVRTIGKNV